MKKKSSSAAGKSRRSQPSDRDTLRTEYDFTGAARGATAVRYAKGTNVVVIDPELADVFPDASSVNEALRSLASKIRRQRRAKTAPRPART